MIRKLLSVIFLLAVFWLAALPVQAQEQAVNIHFFWSKTCPHCAQEKILLQRLEKEDPEVKVYYYELTTSLENRELFSQTGEKLKADISYVPFTVIGEEYFSGFVDEQSTGEMIKKSVLKAKTEGCRDVVGEITGIAKEAGEGKDEEVCEPGERENKQIPEEIDLPLFGKIRPKSLSLPVLTLVLALADGFNPCAMWVLLFLISLLLGMKDTAKMWILGVTFIFTSALVYFLFMVMWLNLFLFIGYQVWARALIGGVALTAGAYMLRDYGKNKEGGCEIMGDKKRRRVFTSLKKITKDQRFWVAVLGIAGLALAVNLLEFFCSMGLPAIYTQTLSLSGLPTWQYYAYMFFYVLIFMLDDLLVFAAAMVTMKAVGVQNRYARWAHLVGGIILLLVGLAMLFKPEVLTFG